MRIQDCHSKGVDDNQAIAKANVASKATKTKKARAPKTPAGWLFQIAPRDSYLAVCLIERDENYGCVGIRKLF